MVLIALNHRWAIYEDVGNKERLDAFTSLKELLAIKTYRQLVVFLMKNTCNDSFTRPLEISLQEGSELNSFLEDQNGSELNLKGSLNSAINQYPNIDYLDELVLSDLKGGSLRLLDLNELMRFQDIMSKFLTIAAIALGSDAPKGLFEEIPSEHILDEEWARTVLHCEPSKLRTIGFEQECAGFKEHGLLGDYIFGYDFATRLNHSQNHEYPAKKAERTERLNPAIAFSDDSVIYEYCEYYPSRLYEVDDESFYYDEKYYLTVSFFDYIPVRTAQMLLAGRIVETQLNSWLDLAEQREFDDPNYPTSAEDFYQYRFIPNKGFVEKKAMDSPWWVTDLYTVAESLIIDGKVSLCPICNSPVLIKDLRGRKPKLVCSDSCKTKASNQRRMEAYKCAANGMPVNAAIARIGKEYEPSILKWYKEAQSLFCDR